MSYLIAEDYKKQIQTDSLNQIIGSDTSVLSAAELAAQEEVTSYLIQKYELSKEFKNILPWSPLTTYKAGDRVYLNATAYSGSSAYALNALCLQNSNVYICTTAITIAESFNAAKWTLLGAQYKLFYVTLPKTLFDYTEIYYVGDQVFWNDKTYTCARATTATDSIQYGTYAGVPLYNLFPGVAGSAVQWGSGVSYSVAAGTLPTDDGKWTAGDNRSQQMVMIMIDIALYHLHSRISPRNIPDLRVKRYDEAVTWLHSAGTGKITANLEVKQVHTGGRIRWGGNVKMNNRY
jgi:phage gp36-like protein